MEKISEHAASPLLKASGVGKRFGGVQALAGADVTVHAGEVHALMGENGAGKSTFGKILAGAITADEGVIEWEGRRVEIKNPRQAQALGIGIIFQELDLFPNLSIAENIAAENLHFEEGVWVRKNRLHAFCEPYLEQVDLRVAPDTLVGELSMGQMQLVAIARALSMQVKVIVMDESTSSLADDAVETLFSLIAKLREQGVAIIYVSHKMDEIFRIADRITVLRDGHVVGTCMAAETSVEALIEMMVGREVARKKRAVSVRTEEQLFSVRDAATRKLAGVSFDLNRGEVLGVAGLVGAGRSELGQMLFGIDPLSEGEMILRGERYCPGSPIEAMASRVGLVPEDRKLQGLMMQMGVRENATFSTLAQTARAGFVSGAEENDGFSRVASLTRLKAGAPSDAVSTLSGGNQQKVLLGRWLLADPDLLFLDDPTRGVDVGAKEDIYALIAAQATAGKGVIMVSSELPELLRCCDRIMVLNNGKLQGIVDSDTTTQEEIMALATAAN